MDFFKTADLILICNTSAIFIYSVSKLTGIPLSYTVYFCVIPAAFFAKNNVTVNNDFKSGYSINGQLINSYLFNAWCSNYAAPPVLCIYAQIAQTSIVSLRARWAYTVQFLAYISLTYSFLINYPLS